ncbi:MAG: redox-sensing transcriptional repressor Rex [Bacteroides sp.]|nr:redox-sensing transcriptional repressor Rex [Bacteroides sp.]
MRKSEKISNSVIQRLPRYYRFLGELLKEGTEKISSRELAERMRLTASQIRQDLNCFGGFGQQGYGYNVSELRGEIGLILGVDRQHKTVLIGAGNLGRAVALHLNFEKYGCKLCGVFDTDPAIIGTKIGENRIMDVRGLVDFCREEKPRIAILCVPRSAAPALCETLIGFGVKAFWNFSHYDINLEYSDIIVENVHLGDSLLVLCYRVSGEENSEKGRKNEDEQKAAAVRPTPWRDIPKWRLLRARRGNARNDRDDRRPGRGSGKRNRPRRSEARTRRYGR